MSTKILSYIKILRLDHSIKHLFVLPGIFFSLLIGNQDIPNINDLITSSCITFLSFLFIGSASYLMNESLDGDLDKLHPLKMDRVLANVSLNKKILFCMYLIMNSAGLFLSLIVSKLTFLTALAFLVSAIIYNVQPIRFKDRPVLDILTESINNPIRLVGGWTAVNHFHVPPLSLVISFWALGSYMMAVKRLSEFRHMSNLNQINSLKIYRGSFNFWNADNLMLFIMGSLSVFFFCFCAFLLRYKVEYLLLLPLLILQILWYFDISNKNLILGQKPEYIYRKKLFLSFCLLFVMAFSFLTYSDIEVIHEILNLKI